MNEHQPHTAYLVDEHIVDFRMCRDSIWMIEIRLDLGSFPRPVQSNTSMQWQESDKK